MVSEAEFEELLTQGVLVAELRLKAGAQFQQWVRELYAWWRTQQLVVTRTQSLPVSAEMILPYSNTVCLLPDDRVQLKRASSKSAVFTIATWNVNSIRSRLPLLLSWLQKLQPDVVCLQETKTEDSQFPAWELKLAGYDAVYMGQKSYNGVCILSKHSMESVKYGFSSHYDSSEKRLLSAKIGSLHIINVYVPQGQTVDSTKFLYKQEFLAKLLEELKQSYQASQPVLLLGDFNIAPAAKDLTNPEFMLGKVCFHPVEHQFLAQLKAWGLTDLYRVHHEEGGRYSWWDFRTRGFEKNEGMRLDHIWGTPSLIKQCQTIHIDTENRAQPQPSDHAPVICEINLEGL